MLRVLRIIALLFYLRCVCGLAIPCPLKHDISNTVRPRSVAFDPKHLLGASVGKNMYQDVSRGQLPILLLAVEEQKRNRRARHTCQRQTPPNANLARHSVASLDREQEFMVKMGVAQPTICDRQC